MSIAWSAVVLLFLPAIAASAAVICPSGSTLQGIDVSLAQGVINWNQVSAAGKAFAFARVSDAVRGTSKNGARITEWELQQFILARFREDGLFTDHGPDVAVNANASNPGVMVVASSTLSALARAMTSSGS